MLGRNLIGRAEQNPGVSGRAVACVRVKHLSERFVFHVSHECLHFRGKQQARVTRHGRATY